MKSVTIHIIGPGRVATDEDRAVLSESETQRASSFRFSEDAARWTVCRSALRRIVGAMIQLAPRDVPLILTASGKPVLAPPYQNLHFSLSHCDTLALIAVSEAGPVGIDVEPLDRAGGLAGCETTFCHPEEIASFPADPAARCLRMLEIWTAKEALLKALGTGFLHPPETIRIPAERELFVAASEDPLPGLADQVIRRLRHPSLACHLTALSTPASVSRVEMF